MALRVADWMGVMWTMLFVSQMSCQPRARASLDVPAAVAVDASGSFRIAVRNESRNAIAIERVVASCSCVTFGPLPARVLADSSTEVTGVVDLNAASPNLVTSILLNGEYRQVRIDVPGSSQLWDRGIIYRTGVRPGTDLGEVAGVYMSGPPSEVEARLAELECTTQAIRNYTWSALRPVDEISNGWYAGLQITIPADAGPEPVTGVFELERSRIRVVLVFDSEEEG